MQRDVEGELDSVRVFARLRARRLVSRGDQRGFMLIFVLATVLLISIVGLAILGYTATTSKATVTFANSSDSLRAVDGALEVAINQIRSAPIPTNGSCTSQSATYHDDEAGDDFQVACSDGGALSDERRILDLVVTRGSSALTVGQARVKLVDKVFETAIAGYSVEVCDWQLGTDVAPTLAGCPV